MHCDGYCDSSEFMPGGRAATVVLYCEEAARGGQTSFSNADVMLKGKAGAWMCMYMLACVNSPARIRPRCSLPSPPLSLLV